MRVVKLIALFATICLLASLPAMADNCNAFASYTCAKSTPDNVHLVGTGTTGQSVNVLLGSNTFSVSLVGGAATHFSGDDLIIIAAAPNGLTGSVNGVSFTSLGSFPEGNTGAITDTWAGLGITASNLQFGYANVGVMGSNPMTITASGVGQGTIFYAELVNPTTGKIVYITANSEAGILDGGSSVTPEPASLTLLGTGLAGLAGLVRRKSKKA
jgi:PEP-CTERM motif-containing protein